MAQQQHVMPNVCSQCGVVFHISYDLKHLTEEEAFNGIEIDLCWNCRDD